MLTTMTIPVTLAPPAEHFEQGLWQIALGRYSDSNGNTATAGMRRCERTVAAGAAVTITAVVDAVSNAVATAADVLGVNPACLAETLEQHFFDELDDVQRLVIRAAFTTLAEFDPSSEAGSAHPVCHPWPAELAVPSVAGVGDGEIIAYLVDEVMPTIPDLAVNPALELTRATPTILARVAWVEANTDETTFVALLQARAR